MSGEEFMQRSLPVYPHPVSYAIEQNELPQYRESHKANVACKRAMDEAIRSNYRDWCLDSKTALAQVSELFSMERITYVLAATIRQKGWDGRISDKNKEWAKTIPVCEDRNILDFAVSQAHPGLIDLFADQVRQECAERKPSVLEKIKNTTQKSVSKKPIHSKGQER